MKKNFKIHLVIESNLAEILKLEAKKEKLSFSEICRRRLRRNNQLDNIEFMLERMVYKNE